MRKYIAILFIFIASSCTKENSFVYQVNDSEVKQPGNNKGTAKSTTEFISIAYADLFSSTVPDSDLTNMSLAYASFGDKKLIEDRIIRTFLNRPGVIIPSVQTMRNDIPAFINNSYKKFFNRLPNEFEKYYLNNFIQSDTSVTPQLLYYSFMTSNEYRYY